MTELSLLVFSDENVNHLNEFAYFKESPNT